MGARETVEPVAPTASPSASPDSRPDRRPSRRWRRIVGASPPALFVLALLGLWEVATRSGFLPATFVPPFSTIALETIQLLPDAEYWSMVAATLRNWGLGLGIAALIGIPLGLAVGLNVWVDRATRPLIEFLRPVPPVALIPVVVLIYGTGMTGAVFLAAFASLWPLVIQGTYGARSIDPVVNETARSFRLTRSRRFFTIVVPSAGSYLMTGLRISAAISLILVVTAGIIIGTPGVGREITRAAAGANYPRMYAMIFTAGLLGLSINLSLTVVEGRLLKWAPSNRDQNR